MKKFSCYSAIVFSAIAKRIVPFILLLNLGLPVIAAIDNEPDSAFIFSYATQKNHNHNGMHFAWSIDQTNWHPIGPEYSYLKSDFGRWGSQKRMLAPVIIQDNNGVWHCLFAVNEQVGVVAHASSTDMVTWRPQSYNYLMTSGNCMDIEVKYNQQRNDYLISWISTKGAEKGIYTTTTNDFKTFAPAKKAPEAVRFNQRTAVKVGGEEQVGTVTRVPWTVIDKLIKGKQLAEYKNRLFSETAAQDAQRFAGLKPVDATLTIHPENSKPISDMLIGIFFEDINYAADGGIYAELVQNRDFEYDPSDKEGHDKTWNSTKAWSLKTAAASRLLIRLRPFMPTTNITPC